jgi:hypothetical protein
MDITHQVSIFRCAELVLLAKILASWNTRENLRLRSTIDMLKFGVMLPEEDRRTVTTTVAELFGNNGGNLVWATAKAFRGDLQQAESEYISFFLELLDHETVPAFRNKNELFFHAIRQYNAFSRASQLFKRAFSKAVTVMNVPRMNFFPTKILPNVENEVSAVLSSLWNQKKNYWVGHYSQRRKQWAHWLESHPNAILEVKQTKIMQLIRYQWLERWLKYYKIEFRGLWDVWPLIEEVDADALVVQSMTKYCHKRSIELELPTKPTSYKEKARAFDRAMEPKLPFFSLIMSVHSTAKEMTRDISKVFKNLFEPYDADDPEDFLQKAWQDSFKAELELETTWSANIDPRMKPEDTLLQDDENDAPQDATPVLVKKMKWESKNMYEALPEEKASAAAPEDDAISMEDFGDLEEEFLDFGAAEAGPVTISFQANETTDHLGFKSPIAELFDKFGRTPDILKWSEEAGVMPEHLRKVRKEEFDRIVEIGAQLLASEKENVVQETYDV